MQSGNANALPILKQILEGQQSERLKERALFVLAQDQSKPAQDLLGQIIRGEKDPTLQVKAIRMLAVTKGKQAADILADVYGKSSNQAVKKAVLDSYLIMGAPDKLVQVAQHESDPELTRHAINELGALGAVSRCRPCIRRLQAKTRRLQSSMDSLPPEAEVRMRSVRSPGLSRIRISAARRSAIWELPADLP